MRWAAVTIPLQEVALSPQSVERVGAIVSFERMRLVDSPAAALRRRRPP